VAPLIVEDSRRKRRWREAGVRRKQPLPYAIRNAAQKISFHSGRHLRRRAFEFLLPNFPLFGPLLNCHRTRPNRRGRRLWTPALRLVVIAKALVAPGESGGFATSKSKLPSALGRNVNDGTGFASAAFGISHNCNVRFHRWVLQLLPGNYQTQSWIPCRS